MKDSFYEQLIKESPMGYARYKIIYDGEGLPADYEFAEVNTAFEDLIGLKSADIIGKRIKEIMPTVNKSLAELLDAYGHIVTGAGKLEFVLYSETLGRWFKISGFSHEKRFLSIQFIDITKEQNQLTALEISQKRLSNIIEGTNAGTWAWNYQTGEQVINERWAEIIGYTIEELSPVSFQTFVNFTHPEDYKESMAVINKVFDRKMNNYDVEFRMRHKDGRWIWINGRGVVNSWTSDGKPLMVSGTHIDITAHKQAEIDLLQSEEKFRSIFAVESDPIFVIDKETGAIIEANESACRTYGYTLDELLKLKNTDMSAEPEKTKQATNGFQGLHTQIPLRYHKKKDGTVFPVEITASSLVLNNRDVHIIAIRDITNRVQMEKKLLQSEEKYRLLAENVSDVISVYNMTQGKFTYVSPSIFELRGLTVEEAMHESLEEAMTFDSFALVMETAAAGMSRFLANPESSKTSVTEIQQPCKNGDIIWVEISAKRRFNADGDIESIGVSRNITDRKNAEKDLFYQSYHDFLTGIYNRRFFEEELKRLDIKRNLPMTIVMGDVNGLKLINDSFGHDVGDELLKKAAEAIRKGCRGDDIIARLGGDEFVILLPETDPLEADQILERIKGFASSEIVGSVALSISFGHETKIKEEESIQTVLKNAEDHMYRHKLYESASMRSRTIDLIMHTLYEKNNREMLHSKRVSGLCEVIAQKLNFDKDEVNQIRIAGLMHDIGKIGIDEKILNKPEQLNDDEWHEIKKHSEIGYRILSSVNEFSEIADYILEHQERWDGNGYPKGLKGEEISLPARIIAVADAYDAMTTERTYGHALSKEAAIEETKRCAGSQFDPDLVKLFIQEVLV